MNKGQSPEIDGNNTLCHLNKCAVVLQMHFVRTIKPTAGAHISGLRIPWAKPQFLQGGP